MGAFAHRHPGDLRPGVCLHDVLRVATGAGVLDRRRNGCLFSPRFASAAARAPSLTRKLSVSAEADPKARDLFATLRRFARPLVAKENCELCALEIAPRHR